MLDWYIIEEDGEQKIDNLSHLDAFDDDIKFFGIDIVRPCNAREVVEQLTMCEMQKIESASGLDLVEMLNHLSMTISHLAINVLQEERENEL